MFFCRLVFFVALSCFSGVSYATTYTWAKSSAGAGTYAWSTAANWSPAAVPTTGDDVIITAPTAAQTITFPTGTLTLNSISVVGAVGKLYTLDLTGCDLVVSGTVVRFTYVSVSSASSINITASDNVLMSASTFGNFPIVIVANSTTKAGGATANNPATNTYTNQALQLQSCSLDGAFTAEAKKFLFTSNTFNGTFTLTKKDYSVLTGGAVSSGSLLNTFNGTTTINHQDNSANGGLQWADRDTYNGVTTFYCNTTNSSNSLFINPSSGTTAFNNHSYFHNSSPAVFTLSNGPLCTVSFSKGSGVSADSVEVFAYNSGTGNIVFGNSGGVTFDNCRILLGNTSSGQIRFSSSGASTALPVIVESTSSLNVFPDAVSAGGSNPYFSAGKLYIDNLLLKASTLKTQLYLGTDANIEFRGRNIISRDLLAKSCNYVSFGGEFSGATQFTNLATAPARATINYSPWIHHNNVSFIHESTSSWAIGSGNSSYVNIFDSGALLSPAKSVMLLSKKGSGALTFAYGAGTYNINNAIVHIKHSANAGTITVGNNTAVVNIDASAVVVPEQTIQSNSTILGGNDGAGIVNFYGTFDASQFTGGYFNLQRFKAMNDMVLSATATFTASAFVQTYATTVFEKKLELKVPNIIVWGGQFKDDCVFHKIGAYHVQNVFQGTVTFKGVVTVKNETTSNFYLCATSTDVFTFEKDLNVIVPSPYVAGVRIGQAGILYLYGDYNYDGPAGGQINGESGGLIVFTGSKADQKITSTGTQAFKIGRLQINKSSGSLTLGCPVIITNIYSASTQAHASYLRLTKGNIITTSTNQLTLEDNATITHGGRHSYIDGPLKKLGNESPFKFFIGKGTKYFPVSMTLTSPGTSPTTAGFTAEFFSQHIPVPSTLTGTLKDLLKCQYWIIDKTGSPNTNKITLSWFNETVQNCDAVDASVIEVARFNSTSWVNEGANNLVSFPGDSGTVESNALVSFGYFGLGSTLANTVTPNDAYAVLKKSMDGSYYSVIDGKLHFRFEEEYAAGSALNYKVFDENHALVTVAANTVHYGDNRYSWSTSGLTTGKYYVLEVTNSKKEKWFLRFKA